MAGAELALVIMAAGKGTRMRSERPKVLHEVCGRPILLHAVAMGRELGATRVPLRRRRQVLAARMPCRCMRPRRAGT